MSDLGQPHRLILVRHGRTPHTAAGLVSGAGMDPQPALDEVGLRQAEAVARHLTQHPDAPDPATAGLFASPLMRTRQTAAAVSRLWQDRAAATDGRWAEADFGEWEGLSVPEIQGRYPGAWERMLQDPALQPPGGESWQAVRERVLDVWHEAAAGSPGGIDVVVTHLTPIRVVLQEALGMPHWAMMRLAPGPGTVTVLDRWRDGGLRVVSLGERPAT